MGFPYVVCRSHTRKDNRFPKLGLLPRVELPRSELQILHQRAARWLGGDHHATSPQDMSFLLADALPAPQNLKMRWLKSMSTTERLNETIEFLSKM